MTISHKRWVRLGDAADTFREWAVTILTVLALAAVAAPLFLTGFLYLLQLAGRILGH